MNNLKEYFIENDYKPRNNWNGSVEKLYFNDLFSIIMSYLKYLFGVSFSNIFFALVKIPPLECLESGHVRYCVLTFFLNRLVDFHWFFCIYIMLLLNCFYDQITLYFIIQKKNWKL